MLTKLSDYQDFVLALEIMFYIQIQNIKRKQNFSTGLRGDFIKLLKKYVKQFNPTGAKNLKDNNFFYYMNSSRRKSTVNYREMHVLHHPVTLTVDVSLPKPGI